MKSLRKDRGGSQEEDLGFEKRGQSRSKTVKEGDLAIGRLVARESWRKQEGRGRRRVARVKTKEKSRK